MSRKLIALMLICFLFCLPSAFALVRASDTNRFAGGAQRLLFAPLQIPLQVLNGTMNGPFLVGPLVGVVNGAFRTVGDLAGGVFDMTAAAAPYAKYALFAL